MPQEKRTRAVQPCKVEKGAEERGGGQVVHGGKRIRYSLALGHGRRAAPIAFNTGERRTQGN